MATKVIQQLLSTLAPGERLCLLPLGRVLVEEPGWLSGEVAILPADRLSGETLNTVDWPARNFQQLPRNPARAGPISGHDLIWAKSAATNIDLPEFFGSALLALPVNLDWDAFLLPESHEAHLEMLGSAMDKAERTMDLIRFENCVLWTPGKLPGRAGLLGDTNFSAGLFYAPEDHESYIIAGQILTHQVIIGVGLDLTSPAATVELTGEGETGAIARHALRQYSEALEASTETSRFVQMIALLEFLANPYDYQGMAKVKKLIARHVARDRADYDAILGDFFTLTSERRAVKGVNQGLRHNIVHLGRRLEDLADAPTREAIFKRLSRYAGVIIDQLRKHSDADWSAIEALRVAALTRLGLTGSDAN